METTITQLVKRLLGFCQTPRTILDGVQYSWAIPLDVSHTDYRPTNRTTQRDIHLHSSAAISIWLAMTDRPCNPGGIDWQEFSLDLATSPPKDSTTMHAGGGTAGEESE